MKILAVLFVAVTLAILFVIPANVTLNVGDDGTRVRELVYAKLACMVTASQFLVSPCLGTMTENVSLHLPSALGVVGTY